VIAHVGTVSVGALRVDDGVVAAIDERRRRQVMRHHSATHLLHRALREVLGGDALQRGSWVGPDHTTFDFPLDRQMTQKELSRVGRLVAEKVRSALPFEESLQSYQQAVEAGAVHLFEEKYGDVVRVVCFGDWTCELCGGTHVANTADIGTAAIVSETSIGSGLRRIDMVVGESADELVERRLAEWVAVARALSARPDEVVQRVAEMQLEIRHLRRDLDRLRDEVRAARVAGPPADRPRPEARVPLEMREFTGETLDGLRSYADRLLDSLGGSGVVAVAGDGRYVLKVSRDLAGDAPATVLREALGPGGGRPELVQGKLAGPAAEAFRRLLELLR
jgi:alanyl-tRNA synthetase